MSWISVTERLPLAGEKVLIYCDQNGHHLGYISQNKRLWMCGQYNIEIVGSYWQRLPELPEKL